MLVTSLPAQQPQLSPTPPTVQLPTGEGTKARALFAPGPEYPEYARKHHWVGVAWYLMHVDTKTGLVTSVEITHSTGHKVLDQAGADALRRWKWKPGAVPGKIKIPITFALPLQKAAQ
ncbi:MAG TPA: energy transducer TonB [Chthoniobacterales bacterium]|nr:energy transducer TonB [Chthoniobacterales bacterium]